MEVKALSGYSAQRYSMIRDRQSATINVGGWRAASEEAGRQCGVGVCQAGRALKSGGKCQRRVTSGHDSMFDGASRR